MFYIDQTTPEFSTARERHYKNVRFIIKKKLLGKRFTETHPEGADQKIYQAKRIDSSVCSFLNDEASLKQLLVGPPDVLDSLKNKFKTRKAIKSIKSLINYGAFSDKDQKDGTFRFYNAFHLAENLGQQTCIYCNRAYTTTVITDSRKFVARPTFDHWFPKGRYPLLALSFYNLIPCCAVCNMTIKGADDFSINDVFHPYFKHSNPMQQMDFRFSYDLENYKVAKGTVVPNNDFSRRSIQAMQLEEMYKAHEEEIRELIYLKRAYSNAYLESLKTILKQPIPSSEVYRLAFGVYLEDEHLHKRPLSKLKKDILTELGIRR